MYKTPDQYVPQLSRLSKQSLKFSHRPEEAAKSDDDVAHVILEQRRHIHEESNKVKIKYAIHLIVMDQ